MQPQEKITAEELKAAPEGSVQFLDVRNHPDDKQIRGSVRYDGAKLLEVPELSLPLVQSLLQYREITEKKKASFAVDQAFTNEYFEKARVMLGK